eukprot:gene786-977_t
MYNDYAFIGSNPNNKWSYAMLLAKNNTLTNSPYQIVQLFSDQTKLYGSSVALGGGFYNHSNITIGAIGSPTENSIYLFNIENCLSSNTSKCDPMLTFKGSSNGLDDGGITCNIGENVYLGPGFIVSTCKDNLLDPKKISSPIAVCTLNLDKSPENCTNILYWKEFFKPCSHERGQLYVTALTVTNKTIAFSYCGICMTPLRSSQIQVQYTSSVFILDVVNGSILNHTYSIITNRTQSCPSSISMDGDWVIVGYPEESSVDLYYFNSGNSSYTLFESITQKDVELFGQSVQLDNQLLIVSSPGNPSQSKIARVYFYELVMGATSTLLPKRVSIEASVPNLNYKTEFNFGYDISFLGEQLMIVSQDNTLTKLGYNFFGVCSAGLEWVSDKCSLCQAGQFKPVSNTRFKSFELCFPCPGKFATGTKLGKTSIEECMNYNCSGKNYFCPDGSVFPLTEVEVTQISQSSPDPDDTEDLDFESTFYNSCYPFFLIILGGLLVLTLSICLPWPCVRYHKTQTNLIKNLLKVNFYDWDGEEMTEDIEYLEQAQSGGLAINSNPRYSTKRGLFVRKRRTSVKPVKAVESFCSYYFLLVLVLLGAFIIQFQRVNSDIEIELRSYGQASTTKDPKAQYTEAEYLKFIDSSPLQITIDLFGYTGNCVNDEVNFKMKGCQKPNNMGPCVYESNVFIENPNNTVSHEFNQTCRIVTNIFYGAIYSDMSHFTFEITPKDYYFYAQRISYNISTMNNNSMINSGNSYVYGVIQPLEGTILRPDATITVLSMLSLISECKTRSGPESQLLALVRPMIDKCEYNSKSYKDFTFLSNSTSYLNTNRYHDSSPTFSFSIDIEKSVFFRYVTSSHSVSFGQIVTVIMFSLLDVFWIIEVFVPVIQTIVGFFEECIKKKRKQEEYMEIKSSNELEDEQLQEQQSPTRNINSINSSPSQSAMPSPSSSSDQINPVGGIIESKSPIGSSSSTIEIDLKSTTSSNINMITEQQQQPQIIDNEKQSLLDDIITEGNFERYYNLISHKKVIILVIFAVFLQILLSLFTYFKYGDYKLQRDISITIELIVTVVISAIVITFPLSISRCQTIYLQILLITNSIMRLTWGDIFPNYEPSYQMFIWINFSLPTAKFWRSSITGFVGIMVLVIIRLIQHYDTTSNIIISQGGAYLLYHISIAFGSRIYELTNRALFAELVAVNPSLPPAENKEIESAFLRFYSSNSILEYGVVFSTVATSIYYVVQDLNFSKTGTFILFNPFKADVLSLGSFILLMASQIIMYTQTSGYTGSLYYLGGVMRVLTLASTQLFFLFTAGLIPTSFVIIPLVFTQFAIKENVNYVLFFFIFVVILAFYSYQREKTHRLRYLVNNLAELVLTNNLNETDEFGLPTTSNNQELKQLNNSTGNLSTPTTINNTPPQHTNIFINQSNDGLETPSTLTNSRNNIPTLKTSNNSNNTTIIK